jgi:hypothetical protein
MSFKLKDFLAGTAGAESDVKKAEARRKLQTEAEDNWGDSRWHREQAALIAEAVDKGLTNPEIFQGVLRYKTLGRTDKLARKTRTGLKVYAVAAGGRIDESTIKDDMVEATRTPLAWHVVATPEEALADYAVTLQTMVTLAQTAEEIEIVRRQLAMLELATPVGSPYYVDASGTGLTPTVLKAAIRGVADADVAGAGGVLPSQVRVIGRALGVDAISDFTGFGLNTLDAINSTGYLGVYRGALIRRLLNHTDSDGVSFMDENYVWVVRDDAGDFARFGAPRIKNWEENEQDKVHWTSRRDTGGYVVEPSAVRRIRIA